MTDVDWITRQAGVSAQYILNTPRELLSPVGKILFDKLLLEEHELPGNVISMAEYKARKKQ